MRPFGHAGDGNHPGDLRSARSAATLLGRPSNLCTEKEPRHDQESGFRRRPDEFRDRLAGGWPVRRGGAAGPRGCRKQQRVAAAVRDHGPELEPGCRDLSSRRGDAVLGLRRREEPQRLDLGHRRTGARTPWTLRARDPGCGLVNGPGPSNSSRECGSSARCATPILHLDVLALRVGDRMDVIHRRRRAGRGCRFDGLAAVFGKLRGQDRRHRGRDEPGARHLALARRPARPLAAGDRPHFDGTTGNNGWFISDVSVSWDVHDDRSPITSQVGCDGENVTTDTSEMSFSCEATSAGGTATESAIVRRDTTAPTVTCATPAPVFDIYQLGTRVFASVTDATSGPAASNVYGFANTSQPGSFTTTATGMDRAGNTKNASCPYTVVIPTCRGLSATRVGTASSEVITGTSGPDVILALGGADTVKGGGGADVICGGDGPDTLYGGGAKDWIDGGASNDDIHGGAGDDTLDGGLHLDSLRGDNGRDTCISGEIRMSSCELFP